MINKFKTEIIPYVGEDSPYVFIPSNITIEENTICTKIENLNFEKENFSDLIKILSSFGSLNLSRLINLESQKRIKRYFLGEKLRIRKLFDNITTTNITLICNSYLNSDRKGFSNIIVRDSESNIDIYSFELNYYIFTESAFQKIYKTYHDTTPIISNDNTLPNSEIIIKNDTTFTINVSPFNRNQCNGHFNEYPIVPAVSITKCILKELYNFLGNDCSYEIDSIEMYLLLAMNIDKNFIIEINHYQYLKDLTYFNCSVKDATDKKYGTYVISLKKMNYE